MKELKLINVEVSKIVTYKKNAKKHPKEQIQQIKESIKTFGFLTPLLIDKKNNLICGHGRLQSAIELGMETLPCVQVEHLTEAQRRAFVHVENRLQESGGAEWDQDILRMELEELSFIDDLDLSTIGFSSEEIEGLLKVDEFNADLAGVDDDDKESKIKDSFMIIVTLKNEQEQQKLWSEMQERGYEVKIP
jgi:ParB-like chromosome segregation protein Spo0J